jgi:hypothetical protein
MHRRDVLLSACALGSLWPLHPALAHHGWSSFDLERSIYLEGTASQVKWRNPHAELMLTLAPNMAVPADLASRTVPAQVAAVDGKALLTRAELPKRKDTKWEVELAPLTRMSQWQVPEIKAGQKLAVLGFTFRDEKGEAVLRAEYLWLDGKVYGLRSSPA